MRVLVLAVLASLPASAAARPVFLPTRDVAVTYHLTVPGRAPQDVRLSYNAEDEMARIDAPEGYYVIGNLPAGQAELVLPSMHAVVQAPDFSAMTGAIRNADGASFTPLGKEHYAGMACENYLVMDRQVTGTACLTPNGVVLHFSGHDAHGRAEGTAVSVSFSPQPHELFTPPQGFTPLDLPPGAVAALLKP